MIEHNVSRQAIDQIVRQMAAKAAEIEIEWNVMINLKRAWRPSHDQR